MSNECRLLQYEGSILLIALQKTSKVYVDRFRIMWAS